MESLLKMNKPSNGAVVKCADCGVNHRLTTATDKRTGVLVASMMVYTCGDFLKIGWDGKKLLNSLKIVHSFGNEIEDGDFLPVDPEFEIKLTN